MSWATPYIQQLQTGRTVQFRPRGASMKGKVESGQLCTVQPIGDPSLLKVGDIVLCRVRGAQYLHLIKARRGADQFLIGNNRGGLNGWIASKAIYGQLIAVK